MTTPKDARYFAGADALAGFLVQTLAPAIVEQVAAAVKAWRQVELGPAPPDMSKVFAEQDVEVERKIAAKFRALDEPFTDDLGRGNVGSGE